MRTKTKRILTASIIALIAFTVMIAVAPKSGYSINANPIVKVKDSVAFPEYNDHTIQVKNSGSYALSADWSYNEQPGFITGFKFTDEEGNTLFSISGGLLSVETEPMKLKAGKYTWRIEYLCDEESYTAFQRSNSLPEDLPGASWFKDGTWHMGYMIKVYESSRVKDADRICCGVIIAIMLGFTIITFGIDDKSDSVKYDERQIAMQGKAYKCGFFTILAINAGLMAFSQFLGKYAETGVFLGLGIVLGACVTVTILIMNDAYFRLDENKKFFYIFFAAFAILNLGLGIRNILNGNALSNGVVSFTGTASLILGLMITYIFIVLLIKKIKDSKEAADEES